MSGSVLAVQVARRFRVAASTDIAIARIARTKNTLLIVLSSPE
jgi:hypothetical protein